MFKRFFLRKLIILYLFAFSSIASFASESIYKEILPNGLTLLVKERHTLPIVSTTMFYKVGSRNEQPGKSGKAHLLEHLMFRSTKNYRSGEIDKIMRKIGGKANAYTSFDYTCYFFDLPSKYLKIALEIEADRMQNLIFDPKEFETEKMVVIEEKKRDLDIPETVFEEEMLKKAFQIHPYRNLILGDINYLKQIDLKDVINFYRTYYKPNNALLVIVGDVKIEETSGMVKKIFGQILRGKSPPEVTLVEPAQKREIRFKMRGHVVRPLLAIAFHAPAANSEDKYVFSVIDNILTYGESSRLFKSLVREKMIFNYIQSVYYEGRDPHIFKIIGEVKEGINYQEAEKFLLKEIEKLSYELPSNYELEKAKNQIEADFYFNQEKINNQAQTLGQAEFLYGGCEQLQRYLKEIRKVTKEDIQRVVLKYMKKNNRIIGCLLPEERK